MKIEDVDKEEIIKLSASILALIGPDDFIRQFPNFSKWSDDNVSMKDQTDLVNSMIEQIKKDDSVSLPREDFLHLYAHTQAVLGFEETKQRFPKVRLLVLNILDDESMLQTMNLIKSIEDRITLNK